MCDGIVVDIILNTVDIPEWLYDVLSSSFQNANKGGMGHLHIETYFISK